jgi:hypothetical protein
VQRSGILPLIIKQYYQEDFGFSGSLFQSHAALSICAEGIEIQLPGDSKVKIKGMTDFAQNCNLVVLFPAIFSLTK